MSHEDEYGDAMIDVLELVWGDGYMAPGGPGNVDRMVRDMDLNGKSVLDIGCGIGGPAFHLIQNHGATVTGIDLEAPLVARAAAKAEQIGIADKAIFQTVEIGPLPFPANSFDLAFSSGALTQTEDKKGMFAEVMRVLKPGGWFSTYDWLKIPGPYSETMLQWFELEGLTYAMQTLEDYEILLNEAGFTDIEIADASDWYRNVVQEEYQSLKGPHYNRMVSKIGQENADHFVENWRVMALVCEKGEMRQGYMRGRKPV
ncbi:MAG: methyltransferase domain-containing protein [Alphaproteobacteria bacterium]